MPEARNWVSISSCWSDLVLSLLNLVDMTFDCNTTDACKRRRPLEHLLGQGLAGSPRSHGVGRRQSSDPRDVAVALLQMVWYWLGASWSILVPLSNGAYSLTWPHAHWLWAEATTSWTFSTSLCCQSTCCSRCPPTWEFSDSSQNANCCRTKPLSIHNNTQAPSSVKEHSSQIPNFWFKSFHSR